MAKTKHENETDQEETYREEREVNGATLLETIQDLINEGTVRRITILDNRGRTVLSFPVLVGLPLTVVTTLMAPTFAAVGAVGALVSGCRVIIERDIQQ